MRTLPTPRRPRRPRPATARGRAVLVLVLLLLATSAPAASAEPDLPSPTRWPLDGAQVVVAGFDPPDHAWGAGHRGIDLAAASGDRVRAVAAGHVSYAGQVAGRGVVVVRHGSVRTTYEPVRATVRVGQGVRTGATIGVLEATGHCDRACLHLGLKRDEDYLDPLQLFTEAVAEAGTTPVRLLPRAARAVAADRAAGRVLATSRGLHGDVAPGTHGLVPPVRGPVTSHFGMRRHPVTGVVKLHDGVDFGAACGTPLLAPAAGTVREAAFHPGYGNRVIIDHGVVDGRRMVTAVNHLSGSSVGPGERVQQGQVVGAVGTTGLSTGCHLHLMLWLDGRVVDPLGWF